MKKILSFLTLTLALTACSIQTKEALKTSSNQPPEYTKYQIDIEELQRKADNGDVDAQVHLGYLYVKGLGVKQDYQQAAKYFRLGAIQGDTTAQFNLGLMYKRGLGVKQNYQQAFKYFKLAADQGHERAQATLRELSARK
ncbi:lipoprotein [Basilea psittacipulmonis]|uniref:lipoprotein n=1 Tax=Basilea psittacipulmonis TaxID=1472345 RepID=UPI00068A71E3|nr:lipoprotein [Basilea psittacipulmonis]